MERDSHWITLQVLLPVSSLVGAAIFFLTLFVITSWPATATATLQIWAVASLLIYGFLWFVMVRQRQRTCVLKDLPDAENGRPSKSNALYFLVLACVFEACMFASFFGGLLEFDAGIYSIYAHSLLGASALVFVVSMAILRIPARWPFLISTALVLAGGAAYYFYIVVPELS